MYKVYCTAWLIVSVNFRLNLIFDGYNTFDMTYMNQQQPVPLIMPNDRSSVLQLNSVQIIDAGHLAFVVDTITI